MFAVLRPSPTFLHAVAFLPAFAHAHPRDPKPGAEAEGVAAAAEGEKGTLTRGRNFSGLDGGACLWCDIGVTGVCLRSLGGHA